MHQRHFDLISYCQEGRIKKVEKYLKKFGMDFLNEFSIDKLIYKSVCPTLNNSYLNKTPVFNKNQFLKKLGLMEELIKLGLNPLSDYSSNKSKESLTAIFLLAIKEPSYLLVIDKLKTLGALPDKAIYISLEWVLLSYHSNNKISTGFLIALHNLDIKINSNNGRIVKSLILDNKEDLVLDIFTLGHADAWFYSREIEACKSQKLKFYFESLKVGHSIDLLEIEPIKTIKKNKI